MDYNFPHFRQVIDVDDEDQQHKLVHDPLLPPLPFETDHLGSNLEANNHQQPLMPLPAHDHDHANTVIMSAPSRSKRRKSSVEGGGKEEKEEEEKKKKMLHKDVEKQRRLEMTSLYSSLRSLLPIEYLKGKRSISDHIHQAANYIKHQERKIEELSCKRDQLKKLSSSSSTSNSSANNYIHDSNYMSIVSVRRCLIGIEVILEESGMVSVSRVVGDLVTEGLNVVSTVSAKVNHRMVHTIKAEVWLITTRSVSISIS
ncbi:Transcription factor bHLH36 [Linum perenne]